MIPELIAACEWDISHYVFVSQNVFSPLIYYSHLTPVVVCLILGIYIFIANRKSLLNKTLLFITTTLSIWLLLDLVLWASDSTRVVTMAWAIVNIIEPIIYAGFLYFTLVFISGKDVSAKNKLWIVLPLLPVILAGWSTWNVLGFNLTNCDREVVEGPLAFYNYLIEVGYVFAILVIGARSWIKSKGLTTRTQSIAVVVSILILLLGFASGNIIGSFSEDWTIGQYGLFVIPVSVGMLSYFVIRLRFVGQSQIMAAQVLVLGLWIAVGSILFIQDISLVRWIVGITLAFLAVLGYILLRSFKLEVEQRKEIEQLAHELESTNKQQVILIHFITHQIKGFVAKSRNIFAELREGSYGVVPETMKPLIEEGFRSDTKGAQTIQEILNAANIKSGKVEYTMQPFDLKVLIEDVLKDLKVLAEGKGLNLTSTLESITFTGDKGQLVNAFKNLIDNSVKYTPSGTVDVTLAKKNGKILFEIKDTGVGIDADDMKNLFTEGGHGKNSQKINVESTGFGLYIVKNIIEAHKGTVRAESEGEGKGSHFIVELPA